MSADQPHFGGLMARARLVLFALDGRTERDGSRDTAAAVDNGRRLYAELRDFQRSVLMTEKESDALDNALDMIRARLRFFGEAV
jgi:hypothetical protein